MDFRIFHVDFQNRLQLYIGKIFGMGRFRNLGGDDHRLAVSGYLLCCALSAWQMADAEDIESGLSIENNSFIMAGKRYRGSHFERRQEERL